MSVFTIGVTVAPGSSGSPVLDEQGRLVGIVYAAGKIAADGEEQDRAIAIPATALLDHGEGSLILEEQF
ncbi:MAG: hypothetical protein PHV03_06855 [Desulfitobacteriaceae bacterium]|nr:hypothetical protein [Desulfitobacteriaceae bacterium]MDD4401439.1 hypothetical protein [Desulfitobacteriaceae bacterium]